MVYDIDGNRVDAQADVTEINNMVGAYTDNGVYDYEIARLGTQNCTWSWWTRPMCEHFTGVRNRLYFGYTTKEGLSGVGMYDLDTEEVQKAHFIKNLPDDHNTVAVLPLSNRKILAAYPDGHGEKPYMYVRISKQPESIMEWEDPIVLACSDNASYAQLLYVNSKYWLFYRVTNYSWVYRTSTDAITWSEEKHLVKSSQQYYTLAVPTNDAARIRFCCTANPSLTDVNIRMGFIDTSTEAVYNANNSTVVRAANADKSTGIANTSFTTIISAPNSGTQRLFDVKRGTAPTTVVILYSRFSGNTDSAYYIYNNGSSVKLCDGGAALWNPKYQLGASFLGSDKIVQIRNSSGSDIVEIVNYSGIVQETLKTESNGALPIRNARPVCSSDGTTVMWQRGYYNSAVYTDFDMDAVIHILT